MGKDQLPLGGEGTGGIGVKIRKPVFVDGESFGVAPGFLHC
jgi:hypothetical protein